MFYVSYVHDGLPGDSPGCHLEGKMNSFLQKSVMNRICLSIGPYLISFIILNAG